MYHFQQKYFHYLLQGKCFVQENVLKFCQLIIHLEN